MGRGFRPETSTDQGTMSAAVMRAVGPPSVLQLETDFPKPKRCASLSWKHLTSSPFGSGNPARFEGLLLVRGRFPPDFGWAPCNRRPGEVLIQVAAASINPIDFKTRGGKGGVPKAVVTLPKVCGALCMHTAHCA